MRTSGFNLLRAKPGGPVQANPPDYNYPPDSPLIPGTYVEDRDAYAGARSASISLIDIVNLLKLGYISYMHVILLKCMHMHGTSTSGFAPRVNLKPRSDPAGKYQFHGFKFNIYT